MDGRPYKVCEFDAYVVVMQRHQAGKFAHALRRQLWGEHLGVSPNDASIADPARIRRARRPCSARQVADSTFNGVWMGTARANTAIFEELFPNIPSDRNTVRHRTCRASL